MSDILFDLENKVLRICLVNRVLPEENFMDHVKEIAERIASAMLDKEAVSHLRCAQTEDHREGVAAFMEKRSANFEGC
jgi:enoyl-CoA hydratase/carnithine racemase